MSLSRLMVTRALLVMPRDVVLRYGRPMAVYAVEIRPDEVAPTVVLFMQDEDGHTRLELLAQDDNVPVILPPAAPRHPRLEAKAAAACVS